jgi:hypothetical protein
MVSGCKKCPVVSVCLLKGVIGDYQKPEEETKQAGRTKSEGAQKK